MEELYARGKIKALGLSNFLPHHLNVVLDNCKIMPVVDQLELHPGYLQEAAVSYAKSKGIVLQAWSPLGRAKLLEDPFIHALANKYGKSTAQICLRFLLQKNMIPLVKASGLQRMKDNMDIFDFEISREDMHMVECMPQTAWSGEHPDFFIPGVLSNFNQ